MNKAEDDSKEDYNTEHKNEGKMISGSEGGPPGRSSGDPPISYSRYIKHVINNLIKYILYFVIVFVIILPMGSIIGEWEGAYKLINLQNIICKEHLNGSFSKVDLEPWYEGVKNHGNERILESLYINQKIYSKYGEFPSSFHVISEIDGKSSIRYVLVAEQGFGKTTSVKKMVNDWCYDLTIEYESFRVFKYALQNYLEGKVHGNGGWDFLMNNILPAVPKMLYDLPGILSVVIDKCLYSDGTISKNTKSFLSSLTKMERIPNLIFAFEFKDIINQKSLSDIIFKTIIKNSTLFTPNNLDNILEREVKRVLLILDGWDEYSKLKYEVGVSPEVEAIVYRLDTKNIYLNNINLIVTTRQWKADDLLKIPSYEFEKLSLAPLNLPKDRDTFIKNFFKPNTQEPQELISLLNEKDTIVPEELQRQPRMLLYICNAWKYTKEIKFSKLKNKKIFWDEIWKMMRQTYNRKYEHKPMLISDMDEMRNKVGHLSLDNENNYIAFETFNDKFGDDFDLFYFGIFSLDSYQKDAPWDEDANDEKEEFVNPVNPSMFKAQRERGNEEKKT